MAARGTSRCIEVMAPSRLHFGLVSFGQTERRQFGGAGVMIQQPGIRLRVTFAAAFEVSGKLSERVARIVRRWSQWHGESKPPGCRIEVQSVPREHVGLGLGTQLGLSVASALNRLFERPESTVAELAESAGRGGRSAVGSYGFGLGGLIVDAGKLPTEKISRLQTRLPVSPQWRIVLVCPSQGSGLSGEREGQAFAQLQPVPADISDRLRDEIQQEMLPAVRESQFDRFARSVFRFGELSGSCFAAVQGGSYRGEELIRRVDWLRGLGIEGVGQSSWGPTLFALFQEPAAAESFVTHAQQDPLGSDLEYQITSVDNDGAKIIDIPS